MGIVQNRRRWVLPVILAALICASGCASHSGVGPDTVAPPSPHPDPLPIQSNKHLKGAAGPAAPGKNMTANSQASS